jgi:uncharacterized FlaG/YvyC family protein
MDVQVTAAAATLAAPSSTLHAATTGAPAALTPAASTIPVISGSDSGSQSGSGAFTSPIGATPGLSLLPATAPAGSKKTDAVDPTLAAGVAKLYNANEQNISVSFQVEQNPNEIVTVFTDKQTGKVIVQFPSETLIALAKFFDKLDGGVVNKKV